MGGAARTPVPLTMEVNTRDDLDGDDRGGDPVTYEAERGPPPGVRNKLTSVLPKILEPVAGKAEDEQPWRSRDGRGRDDDEDRCHIGLEGDHDPASIGDRSESRRRPRARERGYCSDGPSVGGAVRAPASPFSSTKTTCVGVVPMFSPECVCASSHLIWAGSSVTSRVWSPTVSRRSNPLRVIITLSGWSCGLVCAPGSSRYSSTRTRSFSNTTAYLSGSVSVGSATPLS